MKDAKGHGSDKRGTTQARDAGSHQTDVLRIGRPGRGLKDQTWDVSQKTPMGYQTNARYKNPTTAERQASFAKIDQRRFGGGNVKLVGDMQEAFRRQQASIRQWSKG